MAQKKRKILFAAVDIGWRIEHYCKFIQERFPNELDAYSFVKYYLPKKHYDTNYTYMYNFQEKSTFYGWFVSFYFFIVSLFKYDIYHFFSGETLLTRKLRRFEFFIYKLLGKKIILHFVGTDIRCIDYVLWKEKNIHQYLKGNISHDTSLPWQKKLIKDARKYADSILVSTPDLLDIIPEARYYPVVLDIEKFKLDLNNVKPNIKNPNKIVILHAPSNIDMKGTSIIHKVLKEIEKESNGSVELKLMADEDEKYDRIYTVSRYDLFNLYIEADIVVDQLIIGWYGLQAVEALLSNNKVISYIDNRYKKYLYANCPIYSADANTLKSVVYQCIEDIKNGIDNENLEWVNHYHTIEKNNERLIQAWME